MFVTIGGYNLKAEKEVEDMLCNTVKKLLVTLDEIRRKAENDLFIKKMKMQERNKTTKSMSAFSICDDVLLFADWIVMPLVLQKKILKEFHLGHPGISRMNSLMQSYTSWPGIDEGIERVLKTCRGCALAVKAPPIRYKPWPQMDIPWSRIHIDYAGPLNGFYYLVVVNCYTKWPEIFKYQRPIATTTIHALKELFSCFGVPEKMSVIMEPSSWEVNLEIFVDHCHLNILLPLHTIQG